MAITLAMLNQRTVQRKLCGCGCKRLLEPNLDGKRHKINGKEVNSDCYFEQLGALAEEHPIGRPMHRL